MIRAILLSSALFVAPKGVTVMENEEPPVEQPVEDNTSTEVTEDTSSVEETIDEEKMTEKIKSFLGEHFNQQVVMSIVQWVVDSGLIGIICAVYAKYRKYKALSSKEIADAVIKECKDQIANALQEMSKEELESLKSKLDKVEASNEILQKALILAQDKTVEGRIALVNLISQKSESEEVQQVAEEVKETIVEEQAVVDKVQEQVKEDYNPID